MGIFCFHFWFRDLLRELAKKYEILLICLFLLFFLFLASEALLFMSFFWASFHSLCSLTLGVCLGEGFYLPDPCELTFANTLLLSNAAVSLGGAFVSLEITSQFYIFFSLFSFIQAWTFISLQIKEFRIMGLSINDSVYSSVFFFLTGLHFFHLLLGLLLLGLFFWSCSFPFKILKQNFLRVSEVILFSNLLFFYWHFVEILWIFIFLVFYKSYSGNSLNKRNHIDKIYFILTDRHKMKDTNERREILNHKLLIRERKEKKKCERNLHYYY